VLAERRRLLIGGATVVVLGLAAWTLWPAAPAAPTGSARASRARSQAPAAPEPETLQAVKLDVLAASASREQPSEASRNPFRFKPKPPPPPPPRPVVTEPKPDAARPVMPSVPSGPPPLPPIPFKFIGIVTRENGEKWAVLTDGRVTVHGKDGDIIDGRYKIVKIGLESIELTYADGRGRQTVRLTGQ
jgi:hypothetical protein